MLVFPAVGAQRPCGASRAAILGAGWVSLPLSSSSLAPGRRAVPCRGWSWCWEKATSQPREQ